MAVSVASFMSFLIPSNLKMASLEKKKASTRVSCLSSDVGFNVQIMVEPNEPAERIVARFKREVMRAGIIQECKRRRYHETNQEKKKRKQREAAKRNRKRRPRIPFNKKEDAPATERDDFDDDNWEMPPGGIP